MKPSLRKVPGEWIVLFPIIVSLFTNWQVGLCAFVICILLCFLEWD